MHGSSGCSTVAYRRPDKRLPEPLTRRERRRHRLSGGHDLSQRERDPAPSLLRKPGPSLLRSGRRRLAFLVLVLVLVLVVAGLPCLSDVRLQPEVCLSNPEAEGAISR